MSSFACSITSEMRATERIHTQHTNMHSMGANGDLADQQQISNGLQRVLLWHVVRYTKGCIMSIQVKKCLHLTQDHRSIAPWPINPPSLLPPHKASD